MRLKIISKYFIFFFIFHIIIAESKKKDSKFIIITIPKTGTWMLGKCINLLTNKKNALHKFFKNGLLKNYSKIKHDFENSNDYNIPADDIHFFTPSIELFDKFLKEAEENEYLIGHLIFDPKYVDLLLKNNYKIIFLIRDPRDQVISRTNYIYKRANFFSGLQNITTNELITRLIGSDLITDQKINNFLSSHIQHKYKPKNTYISHITKFYNFFLPWKDCKNCLLIRFEDLVGAKGGGSKDTQIRTINKISKFINCNADQKQINKVIEKLFGGTTTFAKGQIGNWKKYFTEEHKKVFKKVAGQLLIDLGYEKNLNW